MKVTFAFIFDLSECFTHFGSMELPLWFDTGKSGWSIGTIEWSHANISKHYTCISFSEDCFCLGKH